MNNIYITSDFHFGHRNILTYCNRPFSSIGEHDDVLIANFNDVVGPKDTCYFLGDFCLGNEKEIALYLNRLNGNIKIIYGNHDKTLKKFAKKDLASNTFLNKRIEFLGDYKELTINNQRFILSHYPFISWKARGRGSMMLHGHCHYNLAVTRKENTSFGKILDVGVDGNNYYPYSLTQILKIMDKKPKISTLDMFNDHHIGEEPT